MQVQRDFLVFNTQGNVPNCDDLGNFVGDPRLCIVDLLSKVLEFRVVFNPAGSGFESGSAQFERLLRHPQALEGTISNEIDNWQST